MGATKNELGINQGSKSRNKKEGGCRTRNGEALISAFCGYYTKNAIWQEWSSIKRDLPKKGLKQRQARVVSLSCGILKYYRQ
jgi:hypothetical protein